MGKAGFAEMHLGVDDSGQNMKAARVDRFAGEIASEIADIGDLATANADIAPPRPVVIDQRAALHDKIEGLHLFRLSRAGACSPREAD